MTAFYITLNDLRAAGACEEERKMFYARFGRQTLVTVTNAVRFPDFDWFWFADAFLTEERAARFRERHGAIRNEEQDLDLESYHEYVARCRRAAAQTAAELLLEQGKLL
jgi:hypothetical protein